MIKTDRNTSKTVKIYLQFEGKLGNDTFEDHEVVLAPIVKLLKCGNSHDQIILYEFEMLKSHMSFTSSLCECWLHSGSSW